MVPTERDGRCAHLLDRPLLVILAPTSCGTNAKGIEDCRSIELARCEASSPCGVIQDVGECQRFYRDHCLHGLAVSPPGGDVVNACVEAIRAAGACAASVDGIDCVPPSPSTPEAACNAVQHPEKLNACSFLRTTPDEGEGGSGNGTGGGSTGGSTGEGGSPDASGGTAGASATGGASSGESGGTGASADAG